ncbi:MAG: NAD(P)-dependent alcohol dehydrogenase [Symploca sp. SIO3E6]|nr:NAD(P)-dependent alcohol dehydrogenase [Caldora sp. SIO3E6]
MMKGLVVENSKITLKDGLDVPSPKNNEVLVKVVCASINPTDLDIVKGQYDLFFKLFGGDHLVKTGLEFSGVIEAENTRFKKGDKVFGYVDLIRGLKTHQEYLAIDEDYIALMPSNLNFEQAAALPLGALTTLVALQDLGQVNKGTEVLINGASGGLGVYAIQVAKIFGARVTAVAGPNQEEFLMNLGSDQVINYQKSNIKDLSEKFDILLDLTTNLKFKEIKNILAKNGKFIPTDPLKNMMDLLSNIFGNKKTRLLYVGQGNYEKLTQIAHWVEEGKLNTYGDSCFAFSDYEKAFQRLREKGKRGRVIIKIGKDK